MFWGYAKKAGATAGLLSGAVAGPVAGSVAFVGTFLATGVFNKYVFDFVSPKMELTGDPRGPTTLEEVVEGYAKERAFMQEVYAG